MTTEQLLEQIKALPEIEFANLMRDLKPHVRANNLEHTFTECGCPTEDEVDELEDQLLEMQSDLMIAENEKTMAQAVAEAAQKELEELKEKLAQYESDQLNRAAAE